MPSLVPPHQPGRFAFRRVVYAPRGLRYGNPELSQFLMFEEPDSRYETRTVDISAFGIFPVQPRWPFTPSTAPLNGIAFIPDGPGPFPLAVFAHGNHNPLENSTPGYEYLCELLASHGIVAATIDVNFLNGRNRGENDARAIIHLEHVRQFRIWNQQPGHPLHGKVALSQVMLAGHSRGGEAVGHASVFNTLDALQPDTFAPEIPLDGSRGLGPYHFGIRGVLAIAPTDGQYIPVTGPTAVADSYVIIHGSRDGDVFDFQGYKTFDRGRPRSPEFKALVWAHQANHAFFNRVWGQESPVPTLERAKQERLGALYVGALAQAVLLGRDEVRPLFEDHRLAYRQGWVDTALPLISQFRRGDGATISGFEVADATPFQTNTRAELIMFDLGRHSHLFQETRGLRVSWVEANRELRFVWTAGMPSPTGHTHFCFRIGLSHEAPNAPDVPLDFTVELSDGRTAYRGAIREQTELIAPDTGRPYAPDVEPKTVMQTVRIPFARLVQAGVDPARVGSMRLLFDRHPKGILYMDDLHFSR